MILNYPNGQPLKFFFLTRGMADTLIRQSIPLRDLDKLSVYHGVLTYGEMAGILKLQLVVAGILGVPAPDPLAAFGTGYDGAMLKDAFNSTSRETLVEIFKRSNKFQIVEVAQSIIMVAGEAGDPSLPGWALLEGGNFSAAMLETIYKQVGYLEAHGAPVVHPKLGEFTLAEVFKLLSIENP